MAAKESEVLALHAPESVPTEGVPTSPTRIELGGKIRNLRLTRRSLVRLEDETGLTVGALGRQLSDASMRAVGSALWAALLHEEPKLTRDEAMDLIDTHRFHEIINAVGAAIDEAFPDIDGASAGKA